MTAPISPPFFGPPPAITLADYFMGRDLSWANELTPPLRGNAAETVKRVNALLSVLHAHGVPVENVIPSKNYLELATPGLRGTPPSPITSGWRPMAINQSTRGAAPRSLHITCQACDLYDPEGVIDDWCMDHLDVLEQLGLWLEHPSATKGWCHVQTLAPRSGRRVFYP